MQLPSRRTLSRRAIAAATLACGLFSCGVDEDEPGVPVWLGEQEHLRIVGTIEGEDLDIGEGGDWEVLALWCQRDYLAPLVAGVPDETQARFDEIGLHATISDGSQTRYLTLELKHHDFQSDAEGTVVEIIPRLDTMLPGPGQMWFEWEWNDELGEELVETAAQDGEFVLERFTGTPGAGTVLIPAGEGQVGGHVRAHWSQLSSLEVSFTATCALSELEGQA